MLDLAEPNLFLDQKDLAETLNLKKSQLDLLDS